MPKIDTTEVQLYDDHPPVNICWDERIKAAEQRGRFNSEDADLSNGWTSCAVGEQVMLIRGEPASFHVIAHKLTPVELDRVSRLGMRFNDIVSEGSYTGASLYVQMAKDVHEEIKSIFEGVKKRAGTPKA